MTHRAECHAEKFIQLYNEGVLERGDQLVEKNIMKGEIF